MSDKPEDSFGERCIERIINRIRFLFSIECGFSIIISFLLFKIPIISKWVFRPFKTGFDIENFDYQQYIKHQNLERLRFMAVIITVFIIVYGIGEVIRRKFKFKSILKGE